MASDVSEKASRLRGRAVKELLSTERTYFGHLLRTAHIFALPSAADDETASAWVHSGACYAMSDNALLGVPPQLQLFKEMRAVNSESKEKMQRCESMFAPVTSTVGAAGQTDAAACTLKPETDGSKPHPILAIPTATIPEPALLSPMHVTTTGIGLRRRLVKPKGVPALPFAGDTMRNAKIASTACIDRDAAEAATAAAGVAGSDVLFSPDPGTTTSRSTNDVASDRGHRPLPAAPAPPRAAVLSVSSSSTSGGSEEGVVLAPVAGSTGGVTRSLLMNIHGDAASSSNGGGISASEDPSSLLPAASSSSSRRMSGVRGITLRVGSSEESDASNCGTEPVLAVNGQAQADPAKKRKGGAWLGAITSKLAGSSRNKGAAAAGNTAAAAAAAGGLTSPSARVHAVIDVNNAPLLLTVEEHALIFGQLKCLIPLHRQLLSALVAVLSAPVDPKSSSITSAPRADCGDAGTLLSVAGTLKAQSSSFKQYSGYMNGYSTASQIISRLSSIGVRPAFTSWLAAAEADPSCAGQTLPSLMIMPVQRLPRYGLLLAEMAKHLPPSSATTSTAGDAAASFNAARASIASALEAVGGVTRELNAGIAKWEAHLRLLSLQASIIGLPAGLFQMGGGGAGGNACDGMSSGTKGSAAAMMGVLASPGGRTASSSCSSSMGSSGTYTSGGSSGFRSLLYEGELLKVCSGGKRSRYYFILLDCEPSNTTTTTAASTTKLGPLLIYASRATLLDHLSGTNARSGTAGGGGGPPGGAAVGFVSPPRGAAGPLASPVRGSSGSSLSGGNDVHGSGGGGAMYSGRLRFHRAVVVSGVVDNDAQTTTAASARADKARGLISDAVRSAVSVEDPTAAAPVPAAAAIAGSTTADPSKSRTVAAAAAAASAVAARASLTFEIKGQPKSFVCIAPDASSKVAWLRALNAGIASGGAVPACVPALLINGGGDPGSARLPVASDPSAAAAVDADINTGHAGGGTGTSGGGPLALTARSQGGISRIASARPDGADASAAGGADAVLASKPADASLSTAQWTGLLVMVLALAVSSVAWIAWKSLRGGSTAGRWC